MEDVREKSSQQEESPWALKLFKRSPLKQEKFHQIVSMLGDVGLGTHLDIGSDNGVISMLLRQKGGNWHSCDIDEGAVNSIRELVTTNVQKIEPDNLPYSDAYFDSVVIVDLLEHIETDREFLSECERVLKPGGALVVNVPNPKEGLLRKVRFLIGQTDEAHGHLRPGYTAEALNQIMPSDLVFERKRGYSRLFSVLIDTFITGAIYILKRGGHSKKGALVTGQDMKSLEKMFLIYSLLYPLIALFVQLDKIAPFLHGNMLIARFRKESP